MRLHIAAMAIGTGLAIAMASTPKQSPTASAPTTDNLPHMATVAAAEAPKVEPPPARDWNGAVNLIKRWEGFVAEPYWDYAQWTWGYGTRVPGSSRSEYEPPTHVSSISQEEAHVELLNHLQERYIPPVLAVLPPGTSQSAADAVVSWNYNTGQIGPHSRRDIYGALKRGVNACKVIMSPDWMVVTAGGNFLQGLENRRIGERLHSGCCTDLDSCNTPYPKP